MKFIRTVAFMLLLSITSTLANAEEAVMIIRFNKDIVSYEKPLEKVIDASLDAKSDAFFDIVSIVPQGDSYRETRSYKSESIAYSNSIIDVMRESGIGPDNIRLTFQNSKLVDNSEVHIFVR
jgi:hypothetical protein